MAKDITEQTLDEYLMEWVVARTPDVETVLAYTNMEEKEYMRGVYDTMKQLRKRLDQYASRFEIEKTPRPTGADTSNIKDIK